MLDETTFKSGFNEPSGITSLYDEERRDVKVYIADTNNNCIRRVYYDVGHVETPYIKGIPACADGQCNPPSGINDSIDIQDK